MGWAQGFESGVNIGNGLMRTYQNAKQQNELEKVANEAPENATGFTPEQGEDLRAAAESGQYDVGYDEAKKSYTVTPKADPSQVGVIAQQGVTDFLGKRSTTMSDSQVDSARQRAMAGVIMKSDPVTGSRMLRDVKQGENDDQRFAWDKSRNERELRQGDQTEKDQQTVRDVDTKTADWFKTKLSNPDGTQRAATIDDHLAASQYRAGALTEVGKVGEAGKVMAEHNSQSMIKIQLEGAQRDQDLGKTAAALNAGDLGAVKDFYNKYVPDGAKVTNVTRGANGQINIERESLDGKKMPPTVMKDTGLMGMALASFKDPTKLYEWSQNEFRNNLALRAASNSDAHVGLAANADKRAQAIFDTEAPVHEANAEIAKLKIALAKTEDPKEQANLSEKITALASGRRGIGAQHDPADLIKASALVKNGIYPNQGEALDAIVSKPDKLYQTYKDAAMKVTMNADGAIESAKKMMTDDGWAKSGGGTWKRVGATAKPATESDAQTQAKAAITGGADKAKVNDRLKSMGYKPID